MVYFSPSYGTFIWWGNKFSYGLFCQVMTLKTARGIRRRILSVRQKINRKAKVGGGWLGCEVSFVNVRVREGRELNRKREGGEVNRKSTTTSTNLADSQY